MAKASERLTLYSFLSTCAIVTQMAESLLVEGRSQKCVMLLEASQRAQQCVSLFLQSLMYNDVPPPTLSVISYKIVPNLENMA